MDQQIRIATDRRGEVRVRAQRQPEVTGVARAVEGLGLAAQDRLHDHRLLALVGDVLEHTVEQPRGDHLTKRQLPVEALQIVLDRKSVV